MKELKVLEKYRTKIDKLDRRLVKILEKREMLKNKIKNFKIKHKITTKDHAREKEIIKKVKNQCRLINKKSIEKIYGEILK